MVSPGSELGISKEVLDIRTERKKIEARCVLNGKIKFFSDVEKYREGISEKVPMLVYLIMSFVTAVIISFAYGWELTLVILSCAPVIIATTAVVAKVLTIYYRFAPF